MELLGRGDELAEVAQRVGAGRRLVTVIGPGGVGKTALARMAIADLGSSFPLGAHVVELSRIDRPDAVAGAVAAQLGFSSFEALLQSPQEQPALLLIDNCEHVIVAAGQAIGELLGACASPSVIATSRSPLGVVDESVVVLGPLEVPIDHVAPETTSSVRLFVERARDAGVVVDGAELEAAGVLCRRLDGLPLAIELAAARTRSMAVTDILARLDAGVGVLTPSRAGGPTRGRRSLMDTIEWSLGLLDDESRLAFERLGVCAGPFDVGVAAAVAFPEPIGEVTALDVIEVLVDASLLVAERTSRGARYRLLEPIRAVAATRLAEHGGVKDARDRFVDHVVAIMAEMLDESRIRWDADLLPRLLEMFDGIDASIRHCVASDETPDRARLLYTTLWGAVHQARVDEVAVLGRLLMGRWPHVDGPFAADAVATLAMAELLCGREQAGVQLAELSAAHPQFGFYGPVMAERVVGLAARARGEHQRAAEHLAAAAEAATQAHVPTMEMECRTYRAQDVAWAGDEAAALAEVRQITVEAQSASSVINELWARTVEGSILVTHDPSAARAVIEATLAHAERIDYPFGVTGNLHSLAVWHLSHGSTIGAANAVVRLVDAMGRAGSGDVRAALELAAAVARAGGGAGWEDLVATAATMPDTNPMVGGPRRTIVTSVAAGRVLERPEAVRRARRTMVEQATPRAESSTEPVTVTAEAVFVRSGDVWDVRFAGTAVVVRSSKGMADLAVLLARPNRDVHCLELIGAGVEQASTGEVIDATARRSYEARVRELQADIDEAQAANDIGRADRQRTELDLLVDHLTAALGIGGHTRRSGSTADRARSAVTHRVRATIDRLTTAHPALGRHLRSAVTTGTFCAYRPEVPTSWRT